MCWTNGAKVGFLYPDRDESLGRKSMLFPSVAFRRNATLGRSGRIPTECKVRRDALATKRCIPLECDCNLNCPLISGEKHKREFLYCITQSRMNINFSSAFQSVQAMPQTQTASTVALKSKTASSAGNAKDMYTPSKSDSSGTYKSPSSTNSTKF